MAESKITFKDIENANLTIRTTDIHGRNYAEVNQRIRAFRMIYPEGFIRTEIVELDTTNGVITMRAVVGYYDDNGSERILGEGTAFEWKNDSRSMVNKTSYVENCETSCVGRALGMIGLGIDVAIASAEEVNYAIEHQKEDNEPTNQAKPAAQTSEITCDDCGKPIKGFKTKDKNGKEKTISANGVATETERRYGRRLCRDCAHKEAEKLKAQKEAEEKQEAPKMEIDETTNLPFPVDQ